MHGIDEDVGNDAVAVAEMMLGDPGEVETQLVGTHHFARDPCMHGVMRIGLHLGVGMRREQDNKFHAPVSSGLVRAPFRSEEHKSELQSLMRISYYDFCLKIKNKIQPTVINKHSI